MASYEKDLENQNYDLMVKLANLQEILDDFKPMMEENEQLYQSLLVHCIGVIKGLLIQIEGFTDFLNENGFNIKDIHIKRSNDILIEKYCLKYLEDALKSYNFNYPQVTKDVELVREALKPFINKFELSGEDDESV